MPTEAYKFTRERKDEYLEHLKRGVGRCQAAVLVGINVKTVEREVAKDQDFALARDDAEMYADDHVAESLFTAAIGGDVTAMKHWLRYRRPDEWADKPKGWMPPGSSRDKPVSVAPGQIDWDNVPLDLAERFLALNDELVAVQPGCGGPLIDQSGR
jgi:hypothetical protein